MYEASQKEIQGKSCGEAEDLRDSEPVVVRLAKPGHDWRRFARAAVLAPKEYDAAE